MAGGAPHRAEAPGPVAFAVLTVSDTRTPDTDAGGDLVAGLLRAASHVDPRRLLVRDEAEAVKAAVRELCSDEAVDAVVVTGGTGVAPRDVTPEALSSLYEATLPGFGELFRMLSFEDVGPAAMLSRAGAGIVNGRPVFSVPGSPAACRLAIEKLVLPGIGHLLAQIGRRRPS